MIGKKRTVGKVIAAALFAGLIVFSAVGLTAGQRQRGPGKGMPRYDPATEVTVMGTVEEVQEHDCPDCPRGWKTGIHLSLRTNEGELLDVHLGPSGFLEESGFEFAEGDVIEVVGSRIEFEGAPALLAREIQQEGRTLVLRDELGRPQWSGGANRSGRRSSGRF